MGEVVVRLSRPDDAVRAGEAAALIDAASADHDIARREPAFLREKLAHGHAALALDGDELVGFGYWSAWEGGRFVSHSGLVVRPDRRGLGLGRRLKLALFDSSRAALPRATLMSLTTSPQVRALNLALGFRPVPLERLTTDPGFWKGCATCRRQAEARAAGDACCCEGMILEPD